MQIEKWDIWLARVPFDDNPRQYKIRPVIMLDASTAIAISFKVTTHVPRSRFPGEYQIIQWREAGLLRPSTIRCSRTLELDNNLLLRFIGKLQMGDIENVKDIVNAEVPEYSHLVEKFQPPDNNSFTPDDDPMFDRGIF